MTFTSAIILDVRLALREARRSKASTASKASTVLTESIRPIPALNRLERPRLICRWRRDSNGRLGCEWLDFEDAR